MSGPTARRFTFEQKRQIAILHAEGKTPTEIARAIGAAFGSVKYQLDQFQAALQQPVERNRFGTDSPGWNDERVEMLRTLAAEGKSAAQIAYEIGATRSAIIGKASRAGIQLGQPVALQGGPKAAPVVVKPSRFAAWTPKRNDKLRQLFAEGLPIKRIAHLMQTWPATIREKVKRFGLVRETPQTVAAPALSLPAPEASDPIDTSSLVSFVDLEERMCRWPVREGFYCGAPCERRASYCDCHRAVARGPGTPSERAAFKRPRVSALSDSYI